MKSINLSFAILLAVSVSSQEFEGLRVSPELINQLSEEAAANNAVMKAARARVQAAEANEKSLPLFKDPELMAGGMLAERMMREEDGDLMFGVEQDLPVFGKVRAGRNVARAETSVEESQLEFERQNLRKEVAQSLLRAALADELQQLADTDIAWVGTSLALAESRFQAGQGSQLELLRLQNERSRREQVLLAARNTRSEAYVALNRLLFRNLGWPWPVTRLPELGPEVVFSEKLMQIATKFEPRVKTLEKEALRAQAMAELTRVERRPELIAGLQNRISASDPDYRSTEVYLKLSVPLFNREKYRQAERRELAKASAAEWLLEDSRKRAREEIHHLTSRIDTARREALLYRDELIPRSLQALKLAENEWTTGNGLLREVLDARRLLIESQEMYFKAVAEQWISLSELVLCCGLGDLDALFNVDLTPLDKPTESP